MRRCSACSREGHRGRVSDRGRGRNTSTGGGRSAKLRSRSTRDTILFFIPDVRLRLKDSRRRSPCARTLSPRPASRSASVIEAAQWRWQAIAQLGLARRLAGQIETVQRRPITRLKPRTPSGRRPGVGNLVDPARSLLPPSPMSGSSVFAPRASGHRRIVVSASADRGEEHLRQPGQEGGVG